MPRLRPESARSIPLAEWPAADRAAWDRATSPGTALGDAGRGASWAAETVERYRQSYGNWLNFLRMTRALGVSEAPEERVTPERLQGFVDSLRARHLTPRSIASYVQSLHNALWAMAPGTDWGWLKRVMRFLERGAPPTRIAPDRLHPIDRVYRAAIEAMDEAESMIAKRPLQDSVRFRDGLLVAIAAATALRRKNLANLDLGRHFTRSEEEWYVAIPGPEVKNRLPFESPLPRSLTRYIDRYLAHHRSRLLQGEHSERFFVTYEARPFSINTINHRMYLVTSRLGYPMSAHDIRRSAATTYGEAEPQLARTIGHFLGHRGNRTSERFYNKAQMTASVRRHGSTIADLKARLRDGDHGSL